MKPEAVHLISATRTGACGKLLLLEENVRIFGSTAHPSGVAHLTRAFTSSLRGAMFGVDQGWYQAKRLARTGRTIRAGAKKARAKRHRSRWSLPRSDQLEGLMSGFEVDVDKLKDLSSQLDEAGSDARKGANYVEDHAQLSTSHEGLLLAALAGSTEHAYGTVHGGLETLDTLCSDLATCVDQAREDYLATDEKGRAELDESWAPLSESGLPVPENEPPSPPTAAPAFLNARDPGNYFTRSPGIVTMPVQFSFDPLTDLFSVSSWVRLTLTTLVGWDPFKSWCQTLSGNWDAYTTAAAVWSQVAEAAPDFADNLAKAAHDTEDVWKGNAADQFIAVMQALSIAMDEFGEVCDLFYDEFTKGAQAAKDLYEALTGIAGQITDYLIAAGVAATVGTETMTTIVGPIAGYGVAGYSLYQIYKLLDTAEGLLGTAKNVVGGVVATISTVDSAGIDSVSLPDKG